MFHSTLLSVADSETIRTHEGFPVFHGTSLPVDDHTYAWRFCFTALHRLLLTQKLYVHINAPQCFKAPLCLLLTQKLYVNMNVSQYFKAPLCLMLTQKLYVHMKVLSVSRHFTVCWWPYVCMKVLFHGHCLLMTQKLYECKKVLRVS